MLNTLETKHDAGDESAKRPAAKPAHKKARKITASLSSHRKVTKGAVRPKVAARKHSVLKA